jgi:hypothetical protein
MQTQLQDLRHATHPPRKRRIATVVVFTTVLGMSAGIGMRGATGASGIRYVSESPSNTLTLAPAVYCTKSRENSHFQSLRMFLSDLLGLDEGGGQISMPSICSMASMGTMLLEDLGVSQSTRRSLSSAEIRMEDRIARLRQSDLQAHTWSVQNGTGRDILVTWMSHDLLRIRTQTTNLPHSATQYSLSVSVRTGNPSRPWATLGLQALKGSEDAGESQDKLLANEDSLDDLLATEVTVISVLPSVSGAASDEAFSASWSGKRLMNTNPLCTRVPVSRASCSQASA